MKIGYLGPPGSYSYEAACRFSLHMPGAAEYVPMSGFSAIIDGVELGQLHYGIIPIENSTHGAVASAMDMLMRLKQSTVCGEMVFDIEHCLLTVTPNPDRMRYVFSHEQALAQCQGFFVDRHPQIEFIHCSSTSQACELAKQKGELYGAVASKAAAQLYNLSIVAENIQDNLFNQTRFLIIGVEKLEPTGSDKTSIVFAFHDDCPGNLFNVLKSFANQGINLTRIESRPAKHIMGKYMFYIDFLGHVNDEISAVTLAEIDRQVSWLKILGSYPVCKPEAGMAGEKTCCGI